MESLILDVSPQVVALIGFMVIAAVKLINEAFDRNLRTVCTILGAAVVGAVIGYGVDGLSVIVGAATGLASSGLITAVGYTKKTTPTQTVPELG